MKNKKVARGEKLSNIWQTGCICTIAIPWSLFLLNNIIILFNEAWRNNDDGNDEEMSIIKFIYVFSLFYFIILRWYGNSVLKSSYSDEDDNNNKKSWMSKIFRNDDEITEEKQIDKTLGIFTGATVTFAYFSFLLFIFVAGTLVRIIHRFFYFQITFTVLII